MSQHRPCTTTLGIDYNWRASLLSDPPLYLAKIKAAIQDFLRGVKGELRVALYGGSASGCLMYEALKDFPDVVIDCVIDKHKPENSLSSFHFMHTDDIAQHFSSRNANTIIFCISPEHNAAMQNIIDLTPTASMHCFMYAEKPKKREETSTPFSERFVEYGFTFEALGSLYPNRVLDVGTGMSALPSLMRLGGSEVIAIDHTAALTANPAYYVWNHDIQTKRFPQAFDMVTCVSTLEHVFNYEEGMDNMIASLREGGHLVLTIPLSINEFVPNVYQQEGNYYYDPSCSWLTRAFSAAMVEAWVRKHGLKTVTERHYALFTGHGLGDGEPLKVPRPCTAQDFPDIGCYLFQLGSPAVGK